MLFKEIVAIYGRSLSQPSKVIETDPVHNSTLLEEREPFRRTALQNLTNAKSYLLDHNAADYVASFQSASGPLTRAEAVEKFVKMRDEVSWPSELVWVEFDATDLYRREASRQGASVTEGSIPQHGNFGVLCDRRDDAGAKFALFRKPVGGPHFDPVVTMVVEVPKEGDGTMVPVSLEISEHLNRMFVTRDFTTDWVAEYIESERLHVLNGALFALLFFAVLDSEGKQVVVADATTLSRSEAKSARKFGKTWMLNIPKSHCTIRIGKDGARHLDAHNRRVQGARGGNSERSSPISHSVRGHQRHYKDGKIVLVKAHKRGTAPKPNIPTRVMGPRT